MLPSTARGAVRPFLFLVLGMLLAGRAEAPGAPGLLPSPPPEYKVTIRYRIRAGANARVAQFLAMTRYLESAAGGSPPACLRLAHAAGAGRRAAAADPQYVARTCCRGHFRTGRHPASQAGRCSASCAPGPRIPAQDHAGAAGPGQARSQG